MQRAQQARQETERILKQQQAEIERKKEAMERKDREREAAKVGRGGQVAVPGSS